MQNGKKRIDYSNASWNKTNEEISHQLNCTRQAVAYKRRQLFGRTRVRDHGVNWEGVDWNKTNSEIGTECNVPNNIVGYHRRKYCPKSVAFQKRYDWSQVDWGKSNKEIMQQNGCSSHAVAEMRRTLFGRMRPHAYNWEGVDWNKTDYQISRQLGCNLQTVVARRSIFSPGAKQGKSYRGPIKWEMANWDKGNKEIAKQLNCSYTSVVGKRISLFGTKLQNKINIASKKTPVSLNDKIKIKVVDAVFNNLGQDIDGLINKYEKYVVENIPNALNEFSLRVSNLKNKITK